MIEGEKKIEPRPVVERNQTMVQVGILNHFSTFCIVYVMKLFSINGTYGIVMHEECFSSLNYGLPSRNGK